MLTLVAKVKLWWKSAPAEAAGRSDPFAVECACGRSLEGLRQAAAQVVTCPWCAGRVFVLPRSPLPRQLLSSGERGRAAPSRRPGRRGWLLAGVGAGAAVGAGLICWFAFGKPGPLPEGHAPSESPAPHLQRGKQALEQGMFQTAARELERARQLEAYPGFPKAERRRLAQLFREARLLADLLEVAPQELLQEARILAPQEWQTLFARRYHGKALVLDGEVSRSPDGTRYVLEYHLSTDGKARIEIADLDLIRRLAPEQPRRLIVGARLAGVERDASGTWVVHLEPDSGVLLTDRDALEAACPALSEDPELAETLQRQRDWLAGLSR